MVLSAYLSLFPFSCYGKIIYGIDVSKTIFSDVSCPTVAQDVKDI
jgi:hypothetical protein